MNTDLKKVKNDEEYFFELMNNPVFGSERNFHTTKFFTEKLLAIKMKKKLKYLTEWTFLLRRFNSTIK